MMFGFFKNRRGNPDPVAFYEDLLKIWPGKSYRNSMDRFKDFHTVFMTTQQGRRVLAEIMTWGHLWDAIPSSGPIDEKAIMFKLGERNMALKLMATLNAEPPAKPDKQKKK